MLPQHYKKRFITSKWYISTTCVLNGQFYVLGKLNITFNNEGVTFNYHTFILQIWNSFSAPVHMLSLKTYSCTWPCINRCTCKWAYWQEIDLWEIPTPQALEQLLHWLLWDYTKYKYYTLYTSIWLHMKYNQPTIAVLNSIK